MTSLLLPRCIQRLRDVHPDLVRVVHRAREGVSFFVTEGVRTRDRQAELVRAGKSQTMNSRHLTGHAVDVAPWDDRNGNQVVEASEISWAMADFRPIAAAMKAAAAEFGIPIVWGGDWRGFPDGPHFELDRRRYP